MGTPLKNINKMSDVSRTFIMVKPDGVARGLVGEIISRFEKKGLKLTAMKMTSPTLERIQEHYADLSSKPFFTGLTEWFAGNARCCHGLGGQGRLQVRPHAPRRDQPRRLCPRHHPR